MPGTYLTTPFRDKDRVKALGARWDALQKSWCVPEGMDLAPFASWLPSGTTVPEATRRELQTQQGVSLSQLLAGVSQAVAAAYRIGVAGIGGQVVQAGVMEFVRVKRGAAAAVLGAGVLAMLGSSSADGALRRRIW
jgi:hypothetical protein